MNRTADQPEPNPLREGLSARPVPQPCSIVIFGATGDLTHRKLVPALYNLAADGELPPDVVIVGFARRKKLTMNSGATSKNPRASFPASLCATKFGTHLRNRFFITRASSAMNPVTHGWPNVSMTSIRATAPAGIVFFTWRLVRTNSNRSSKI